jgi:carbamoyltransferase
MSILGIWDGHDAGAALIVGDRLVAAVNEERFTRRKLEPCFPLRSIRCCLEMSDLPPSRIDHVAVSTADFAKTLARWFPSLKESYYQIRRRKVLPGPFSSARKQAKYWITEWGDGAISRALSRGVLGRELHHLGMKSAALSLFDHHHGHAAAAAWASGYPRCAVVTIDGVGDGLSSTISKYVDGQLHRVAASRAQSSLGIFFEHVTNLLNMRELEDEGKVMALADYAAPVPDADNPLLDLFRVRDGEIHAAVPGHSMMAHLRRIQFRYPNEQFARMAQRTVETVCGQLVLDAVRLTGLGHVAMAGGVASNVKANRLVRLLPPVEDLYVFPHMGDGGLALGAALAAAEATRQPVRRNFDRLDLGPEYPETEIASAMTKAGLSFSAPADFQQRVADLLAADRIVLWFQGRMEYGPRALGHRSVLARPDRTALRDRLNLVLKQRVWYQPFCPSMLETEADRLLADFSSPSNRHMTMAFVVKPCFREALLGVTSVDGTCRPHIVPDAASGRFADVLRAIKTRIGVAAVLNTSFNIHGEPLVCRPEEAIDVYHRTGADALAIGPFLTVRTD